MLLNHEFLADQGAIDNQSIAIYYNILLDYASGTHHTGLESAFNYSSTKKRMLMLSQSFSRKRLIIATILLIPLLLGCVFLFNKAIIEKEELAEIASVNLDHNLTAQSREILVINSRNYEVDSDQEFIEKAHRAFKKTRLAKQLPDLQLKPESQVVASQEKQQSKPRDTLEITVVETGETFKALVDPSNTKISEEEINAYISWVKKILDSPKKKRIVSLKEYKKMLGIYTSLNSSQKETAPKFPIILLD